MTKLKMENLTSKAKLQAAAKQILIDGPEKDFTVRGVAALAGVNHGLVHHYFKSMEGLVLAILEDFTDELFQNLLASLPEKFDQQVFLQKMGENLMREEKTARLFFALPRFASQMPLVRQRAAEIVAKRREQFQELLGVEATEDLILFQTILFGSLFMSQFDPMASPLKVFEHLSRRLDASPDKGKV